MAPHNREKKENNEEKLKTRNEKVMLAMRRYRQKKNLKKEEERTVKDIGRKKKGLVKNISELKSRAKLTVRKRWQDRSKKYRDKKKNMEQKHEQTDELIIKESPPDSPRPTSLRSKTETSKEIMKSYSSLELENTILKEKLRIMENKVKKYKMLYNRAVAKININNKDTNSKTRKIDNTKKQIQEFLETDECSRLTDGKCLIKTEPNDIKHENPSNVSNIDPEDVTDEVLSSPPHSEYTDIDISSPESRTSLTSISIIQQGLSTDSACGSSRLRPVFYQSPKVYNDETDNDNLTWRKASDEENQA